MNIELTAQTTKLLHLSVMDLCSIWSHQLCPRNPGLVFWLCHQSIVWVWANPFIRLCLSVLFFPTVACLWLLTYCEDAWEQGLVSTVYRKCYLVSRFLLKPLYATSQISNNNIPIHISLCLCTTIQSQLAYCAFWGPSPQGNSSQILNSFH